MTTAQYVELPISPLPVRSTGIEQAVLALGSQAALADRLKSRFPHKKNPSQQAISQWVQQGYVPVNRAREIATVSGVEVTLLVSPSLRNLFTA